MCMGCSEDDMTDDVVLFEFASGHTAAAAALRLKRRGGNRFHILCLGHDNDEFFIFNETPHSIRDKGYRNLTPITPGNFGYSVLRTSALASEFSQFMDYCSDIQCELEGLHCETGPGVWEAALVSQEGLEAADRASLFKTLAKGYFQRRDMLATFMAKWSMDYPGQSGHLHLSISDEDGKNIFWT